MQHLGAWFPLTWLSQTDQRGNAKHFFFSHLSRTRSGAKMSLPGWSIERHISPTINTSIQQLSKSRTWSSRLSSTKPGETRVHETHLTLSNPFLYRQNGKSLNAKETQTTKGSDQSVFQRGDSKCCWWKGPQFSAVQLAVSSL